MPRSKNPKPKPEIYFCSDGCGRTAPLRGGQCAPCSIPTPCDTDNCNGDATPGRDLCRRCQRQAQRQAAALT